MRRHRRNRRHFSDSRLAIRHSNSLGRSVGTGRKTLSPCGHLAGIAFCGLATQPHLRTASRGLPHDRSRRAPIEGWFFWSLGFAMDFAVLLHGDVPRSARRDAPILCKIRVAAWIEPVNRASPSDPRIAPSFLALPESRSRHACSRAAPRDP